ncbi:hypothetical protein AB3S75_027250 [Citrus x aurantiifolia]
MVTCEHQDARVLKKYVKWLNTLQHQMLQKLGGAFAVKPSSRECLPFTLILQKELKYAHKIWCKSSKVTYAAGFLDAV